MNIEFQNIALIAGIIVGSAMVLTVLLVYYKTQTFALGGSVLTVFGTILIGLSIWANVEVSIGMNGEIEVKLLRLQSTLARNESKKQIQNMEETAVPDFSLAYGDPIEFRLYDPTIEQLNEAFRLTDEGESFGVILSKNNVEQYYIQSAKFSTSDNYRIEYREGSAQKHYYTYGTEVEAIKAFTSFLNGNDDYKSMFSWEKMKFN